MERSVPENSNFTHPEKMLNTDDIEVDEHAHFAKVQKISKKLYPLVEVSVWLVMLGFIILAIIFLRQLIQPFFSDAVYTPWLEPELLLSWQVHSNYLNLFVSVSGLLTCWFLYLFSVQLRDIVMRLMQKNVFAQANASSIFKMAKYYLMGVCTGLPFMMMINYLDGVSCQDTSFSSEFVGSLFGIVASDIVFAAMLFIIGHIITLAIKLDYEQKLTV